MVSLVSLVRVISLVRVVSLVRVFSFFLFKMVPFFASRAAAEPYDGVGGGGGRRGDVLLFFRIFGMKKHMEELEWMFLLFFLSLKFCLTPSGCD